jgi:GTP pyrophosphokinase
VAKGHEVLDRELGRLGMKSTVSYEQVAALFRLTSSGELLSQIGSGQISSDRLRSVLTAQPKPTQGDLAREAETELVTEAEHATTIIEREPEPERRAAREPTGKGLLVAATDGIHSKLAKCCYPIPREAIVGFVTRGYGATIHVADCPNVTNVQDVGRIIPAAWGDTNTQTFPVMVMVEAINRRGLLGDIAQSVAKEKVDIREAKALKKGHWALFELLLEVATTNQLDRVMKKLADTKGVREVHRKRG